MIKLVIEGTDYLVEEGTTYLDVARRFGKNSGDEIMLCLHGNRLRELSHRVFEGGEIRFITAAENCGSQTYKRTAVMVFIKSVLDVVGRENVKETFVDFSISKGYYIEIKGELILDDELVTKIDERMHEIAEADIQINKRTIDVSDAMDIFRAQGMDCKERLFRYRMSSRVNVYELDGYYDYFYGYMLPSTGYVKYYSLHRYGNGVVLQFPDGAQTRMPAEFMPQHKVTRKLLETARWNEAQNVRCVADLNDRIVDKSVNDLILIQEAHQNQELANIASMIKDRGNIKFIMVAGPSSSGKTSFSHRLSIHLRANGYIPHPIGVDDYFVDRERTPRDENGEYNFEDIECIDRECFNNDMSRLLSGEKVEMPHFDFATGQRVYRGDYLQLGEEDILIIEGIHCLNPALYPELPQERMFKIYISALTQLNVDEHNRVSTTDGRLIRRMARDAAKRSISATETIQRWASVRRGEENNIFPFQETADVIFNSALCYELPVLKTYAQPLLFSVPADSKEYLEAKRLLKFLDYFLTIPADNIPRDSILREFIGGSIFPV
ncbi:MAG: nucleoside kinase [Lachnospiraceae bacterium]|nr:nucleoside kinase [Lachnospiraceae bacterium]